MPAYPTAAVARLKLYNEGEYDVSTNPYGFDDAGYITNFTLAMNDAADVTEYIGGLEADLSALADIEADITAAAAIAGNITTVAGIAANVTTVAGIAAAVSQVATDSAAVTQVAADTSAINILSGLSSELAAVAAVAANLDATANSLGLVYAYSTTTTDSDPGAGTFRLNNADPASATAAYVDNADGWGNTVTGILDGWDDGTSAVKGTLRVWDLSDPSITASYRVTGSVVDGTGYRKLTLSYVSGSLNGTFVDGHDFALSFVPKGDKGDSGDATAFFVGVRVASTGNVAISTALEAGDSLDGVTLAEGDKVLLTAQSAPAENGIYVVQASGAAVRDTSYDAYDDFPGVFVSVSEGTTYADTTWRCTSNAGGTIDSTSLVFARVDVPNYILDEDDMASDSATKVPTQQSVRAYVRTGRPRFKAHKNGTNQTGIASITYTKVTATTEAWDVGSYYDAANSRWTPPAGKVRVSVRASWTDCADSKTYIVAIYKNGSIFQRAYLLSKGTGYQTNEISVEDAANGTDYYEIYVYLDGGGTIGGLSYDFQFTGEWLAA